ncbi:MAG: hypothetical protein Tsb0020_18800 [Haliangiales bacterium]
MSRPDARQAAPAGDPSGEREHPYRMKDLCEQTGLTRQAIHFYIQQGLLPPGHKTGRNMAYYSHEHVAKLDMIRKLQRERFLPLKAIKAVLSGDTGDFVPAQRQVLRDIKARLTSSNLKPTAAPQMIAAKPLCKQHGVSIDDLERMAKLGLVRLIDDRGPLRIPEDQVWIIEHWGRIRALGFSEELGFGVEDMVIYEETISSLFEREKALILPRLGQLSPDRAAIMLEQALPAIHAFLSRYHLAQIRNFLAAVE